MADLAYEKHFYWSIKYASYASQALTKWMSVHFDNGWVGISNFLFLELWTFQQIVWYINFHSRISNVVVRSKCAMEVKYMLACYYMNTRLSEKLSPQSFWSRMDQIIYYILVPAFTYHPAPVRVVEIVTFFPGMHHYIISLMNRSELWNGNIRYGRIGIGIFFIVIVNNRRYNENPLRNLVPG